MLVADIWTVDFIESDQQSSARDASSPDWHKGSISLPVEVAADATRVRHELTASIDLLVSALFQRANEHAQGRCQAEIAVLHARHQEEVKQLQAEHATLLDHQRANLERRDQCNKKLVMLLDRQRANLEKLQADYAAMQDRHQPEIDRLEADRTALQAESAASRAALSEIQSELERTREALTLARSGIVLFEERVRAAEEQRDLAAREAAQHVAALRAQVAAVGDTLRQMSRCG